MKKLAIILVISLFMGVGVAHAQNESDPELLPGHPLYFMKAISEGIGGLFSFGSVKKINRSMNIAEERLIEAYVLMNQDRDDLARRTVNRYKEQINKIKYRIESELDRGEDVEDIINRFAGMTLDHQRVLLDVYVVAPEEARENVFRALQTSREAHDVSMSWVSGERRDSLERRMEEKREALREKMEEMIENEVPVPDMPFPEKVGDDLEASQKTDTSSGLFPGLN